jgi:hypothetical protein
MRGDVEGFGRYGRLAADILRPLGFERHGNTYELAADGGDAAVLQLQRFQWGAPRRSFTTLNLGVRIAILEPWTWRFPGEVPDRMSSCHWRARIGGHAGRSSTSWATDPDGPRTEVGADELFIQEKPLEAFSAALLDEAVPTVTRLLDHRALRDYWLGGDPSDELAGDEHSRVLYCAVLSARVGDAAMAARLAARFRVLAESADCWRDHYLGLAVSLDRLVAS